MLNVIFLLLMLITFLTLAMVYIYMKTEVKKWNDFFDEYRKK